MTAAGAAALTATGVYALLICFILRARVQVACVGTLSDRSCGEGKQHTGATERTNISDMAPAAARCEPALRFRGESVQAAFRAPSKPSTRRRPVEAGRDAAFEDLFPASDDTCKKVQEWLELDKGLRNVGKPPGSAFKIPALGREVLLATKPTSITREQFWWVMEQWIAGGESYIKSIWRTHELQEDDLTEADWEWARDFCPTRVFPRGRHAVQGQDSSGHAREPREGSESLEPGSVAAKATAAWGALVGWGWRCAEAAAKTGCLPVSPVMAPERALQPPPPAERRECMKARQILRRMDRKDVVTAPFVDEWVTIMPGHVATGETVGAGRDEGDDGSQTQHEGVSFTPILPKWVEDEAFRKPVMSYLPYNYPKSRRYAFYYIPGRQAQLRMTAHLFDDGSEEYLAKTADKMLSKLEKWGQCVTVGETGGQGVGTSYQKRVAHDGLVEEHAFRLEYQRMKKEHKHWAKQWPEKTDPQKFVFEETGIAAYLIALWATERFGGKHQTFVDLGCGNGFLTHLLTVQGHVGCGIDRQRRKIWDIYGGDTSARLQQEDIDPETCVYPGVDWVIGNHSDELTPWLPKIARRCGRNTRYFVIPCCFWDFTRRYTKKAHKQTRYETYLNFIRECGQREGFTVFTEALRIPSTKNMAQVGVLEGEG